MAQIICYALIDKHGERILLGDVQGQLFMLVLDTKQGERYPEVYDIKVINNNPLIANYPPHLDTTSRRNFNS